MTGKQRIARLEKDLAQLKRTLESICETVSFDDPQSYPGKIGAVRAKATWGLYVIGDTTWMNKFDAEHEQWQREFANNYNPTQPDPKPLLRLA